LFYNIIATKKYELFVYFGKVFKVPFLDRSKILAVIYSTNTLLKTQYCTVYSVYQINLKTNGSLPHGLEVEVQVVLLVSHLNSRPMKETFEKTTTVQYTVILKCLIVWRRQAYFDLDIKLSCISQQAKKMH
jgi:hypothetical protein